MKIPRLMIASPMSGSGKTMFATGVIACLDRMGKKVSAFKSGPDYIDPMYHRAAGAVRTGNLDTWFTDRDTVKTIMAKGFGNSDILVTEGAMGLYDGLGSISDRASTYETAVFTQTPIVLCVDARRMGNGICAILKGQMDYDREGLIRGTVLNRINNERYEKLKPLIERETGLKVCGHIPEDPAFSAGSRHLGLMRPGENGLHNSINQISEILRKTVDFAALMDIADSALDVMSTNMNSPGLRSDREGDREGDPEGDLRSDREGDPEGGLRSDREGDPEGDREGDPESHREDDHISCRKNDNKCGYKYDLRGVNIAVARDDAFCFYYSENLEMLEEAGAKLTFFSPLTDHRMPQGCGALLLGGGYPELYLRQLSENTGMPESIREFVKGGGNTVAECGGFMYLLEGICDRESGDLYEMCGIFPGKAVYAGSSVRFGYGEYVIPGIKGHVRGHEFHHYDSPGAGGTDCSRISPVSGEVTTFGYASEKMLCGWPHFYYPSDPDILRIFAG